MGYRTQKSFTATQLNTMPASGEGVICTTPQVLNVQAGQVVIIGWALSYVNGAAPVAPVFIIRRGTTTAGALVYSSGTLSAPGANSGAQWSGTAIDIVTSEIATQYSLNFNNTNSGTQVGFQNTMLWAFVD